MTSIYLGNIDLFGLFNWSLFNLDKQYLPRKLSISFSSSICVEYRFLKQYLMILLISLLSVVMSPISFQIFLIWILPLCLSVDLAKGLSSLLIISKKQLLVSLILCNALFVSILLISLRSLIFCHLFLFSVFISLCSRVYRCAVMWGSVGQWSTQVT